MNALARLCAAALGFALCLRGGGSEGFVPAGPVSGLQPAGRGWRVGCADGSSVRLSFPAPDVARVRVAFPGQEEDGRESSWAVEKPEEEWAPVPAESWDGAGECGVRTAVMEIRIQKDPLRLRFADRRTGETFLEDESTMARDRTTGAVAAWRRLGFDEHFYGLGERAARLDRRRGEYVLWNSDTPGYAEGTDPLYQSIPFYLGMRHGRAYGIFHDNPFRSRFDFGRLTQEHTTYIAEGGALDFYVFAGPELRGILRRYGELTGRMPLPPLWALGHHQSRYSYYPDTLVELVADTCREHGLPLDAVYLDIHYMDGYRSFTWDRTRFPDPKALLARLQAKGVRVVTIIDPGIKYEAEGKGGYGPCDEGLAGGHFLRRRDGALYVGEVWPGAAVFPDFSRTDTRRWWGELHRELVGAGVAGIWNDMNEPSDFRDKTGAGLMDVVFDRDGRKESYLQNRNVFGLLMSHATYEGLLQLRPDRRPFVITRAGFAGIQRYAATWTGDNLVGWESLALGLSMYQSMGLSGQAFVGGDLPGFIGRADGELLVRSYEASCLVPLFRNHGAIDGYDHEPWRFGPQYEEIVRNYIRLRYRLLPYLYTCIEEAHREGVPVIRPLVFEFQDDPGTAVLDDQFMIGSSLMAAPVLRPGERGREVYFPAGVWYDFWTGARMEPGFRRVEAPLDRLPLYVRGGAILPSTVPMNHVAEKPWNPVRFDAYPDADGRAEGCLYEDDGLTLAYQKGEYRKTRLHLESPGGTRRIVLDRPEGPYLPPPRDFELAVHDGAVGRPGEILLVRLADDGGAHIVEMPPEENPAARQP